MEEGEARDALGDAVGALRAAVSALDHSGRKVREQAEACERNVAGLLDALEHNHDAVRRVLGAAERIGEALDGDPELRAHADATAEQARDMTDG